MILPQIPQYHTKIVAPPRWGKTTIAHQWWRQATFAGQPTILFDPNGTFFRSAEADVADRLSRLSDAVRGDDDIPTELAARMLQRKASRYHFLRAESGAPMGPRINITKRRLDETVESAAKALTKPFSARFHRDYEIRTQFEATSEPIFACLVAADLPIEFHHYLVDPLATHEAFWPFLVRRIEGSGVLDDHRQGSADYVRSQMDNLSQLLALRSKPTIFQQKVSSTDNALTFFEPGKLGAAIFGQDSFDPLDVVTGTACFAMTVNIGSDFDRAQFIRIMEGVFQRLARQLRTRQHPLLTVFVDEFTKSAHPDQMNWISDAGNFHVRYVCLYQSESQWETAKMPEMQIEAQDVFRVHLDGAISDPDVASQRAMLLETYDPFAMTTVRSVRSRGIGSDETESEDESGGSSDGGTQSGGTGWGDSVRWGSDGDGDVGASSDARSGWSSVHHVTSGWRRGASRTRRTQESESEQLLAAGASEQHVLRMQELMQMERHMFLVHWDGFAEIVKMPDYLAPTASSAAIAAFRQFTEAVHTTPERKPVFDPSIVLTPAAPVEGRTRSVSSRPEQRAPRRTSSMIGAAVKPMHVPPDAKTPPESSVSARTTSPSRAPENAFPFLDKSDGVAKRAALLRLIATVRLCTVTLLIAVTHWSYDKCYRELDRLLADGLLDRVKPYAPRGEGSAPIIYILNANGARALGDTGAGDFDRIAKNLAVFRRTVEANRPVQMEHRMWSTLLATHVVSAVCAAAPTTYATDVRFDRERTFSVDLSPFTIPPRHRSLISPNPTLTTVTYVPDFFLQLHRERDGTVVRDIVIGEVETGFGERSAKDLAIGKSWKIRALMASIASTGKIGNIVLDPGAQVRVVVWCRTAAIEQGFFDGAAEVFEGVKSPFWIASGERVPLTIPPGTKKKDVSGAVRRLVDAVQDRVWRWLRFPDPTDRRRFVATGD